MYETSPTASYPTGALKRVTYVPELFVTDVLNSYTLTLRPHTARLPSLHACLKGFSDGTSVCRRRTPGSLPGHFVPALRLRVPLGFK
jgi:hypothetical protein